LPDLIYIIKIMVSIYICMWGKCMWVSLYRPTYLPPSLGPWLALGTGRVSLKGPTPGSSILVSLYLSLADLPTYLFLCSSIFGLLCWNYNIAAWGGGVSLKDLSSFESLKKFI
jgi:hypothetical protein